MNEMSSWYVFGKCREGIGRDTDSRHSFAMSSPGFGRHFKVK